MTPTLKKLTPIIALFALTLIFFWKIILTNLILVGVDVFLYFYPYKAYATDALLSGRLPLWNPHIFMGVPFLANSQVGLLYPPNWLFLWASPPKQVAYSIGLHIFIAGVGAFLFARKRLNLPPMAALVGGMVFAFSGFLGGQVEHLNQLQVSAWLPWLFWAFDGINFGTQRTQRLHRDAPSFAQKLRVLSVNSVNLCVNDFTHARRAIAALGVVIALMLLAGHTQSAYISLFGLGLYGVFRRLWGWIPLAEWRAALTPRSDRFVLKLLPPLLRDFLPLIAAIVLAVLIAAAQLIPTAELTRFSIRSGGLTFNEVVSFSVNPLKLPYTLFPPFGVDLEAKLGQAFSEFVAYVGLVPLILIALAVLNKTARKSAAVGALILTGLSGLFLSFGVFVFPVYYALFKLVPGFNLFRVPARWLLLYTFAAAMLAAIGFAQIKRPRRQWLALALIPAELFFAAQGLRYNQPTAPEAYSSLRPSIAQLKVAQTPTDRFLSLSGIVFDPGDLAEIHDIFDDQLPPRAVYDYIIAAKEKEVLFFNLPMVFGLNAVDGYDGGLLPLKSFINLEKLFLPDDNLSLDGRLREKLTRVPENRLLSLLGVRHIVTDKVFDVWLNDVFYDLQFPAVLTPDRPEAWTTDIPADFPATGIGVVFHPDGDSAGVMADLIVRHASGAEEIFGIKPTDGTPWENAEYGMDFNVVFDGLPADDPIVAVGVAARAPVTVRGVSLIQPALKTSRSLLLTTEGQFRVIHGGDVKIYENLDVLPRAFAVHTLETVPDMDAAIARLKESTFDPAAAIVQVGESAGTQSLGQPAPSDRVEIVDYAPESIAIRTDLASPGWVLLTDTAYPGWVADIDGTPAPILTADVQFRAVEVPAGTHTLTFRFRPRSVWWGIGLSVLGLLLAVTLFMEMRK